MLRCFCGIIFSDQPNTHSHQKQKKMSLQYPHDLNTIEVELFRTLSNKLKLSIADIIIDIDNQETKLLKHQPKHTKDIKTNKYNHLSKIHTLLSTLVDVVCERVDSEEMMKMRRLEGVSCCDMHGKQLEIVVGVNDGISQKIGVVQEKLTRLEMSGRELKEWCLLQQEENESLRTEVNCLRIKYGIQVNKVRILTEGNRELRQHSVELSRVVENIKKQQLKVEKNILEKEWGYIQRIRLLESILQDERGSGESEDPDTSSTPSSHAGTVSLLGDSADVQNSLDIATILSEEAEEM
mmetsp:Transcript_53268/g.61056  ORF Transcript_53268/g.61056 Transcript_53268/m.61056 type:complete len:295 (-) Transcript_53268:10-894(-)